jgi:hypothetical protein
MVTHLPARFHILVRVVRVISPGREGNNLVSRFADPFLPARRPVLPRVMSEERDIFGQGSDLPSAIKLRNVLDCQAKILEAASGFRGDMQKTPWSAEIPRALYVSHHVLAAPILINHAKKNCDLHITTTIFSKS